MPKNKKSESTSDSDSGPDDVNPPATKKTKDAEPAAKKTKDVAEPANEWTLEKLRKVKINEFRGRKTIDIREYYEKDGQHLPGRKGISLSLTQWKRLLECADEISAAMDE